MLELVKNNPASPIHWGKNQPGMQANEELDADGRGYARFHWQLAAENAVDGACNLASVGLHKEFSNRLTEPFQMIRVLVTATSFDNFFNLRFHEDAQPEIAELARCMLVAFKRSVPEVLHPGEWHTPFVEHERSMVEDDNGYTDGGTELLYKVGNEYLSVEDAIKVSCSCAAQTSYRKVDTSIEKALSIYEKLVGSDPAHSSAFEHCATPMIPLCHIEPDGWNMLDNHPCFAESWEKGITHTDGNYLYSNNFKGWIQYRALIPNNVCVSFDYNKEVDETGLEITDVSGEEI
jgi:hypothetical protein